MRKSTIIVGVISLAIIINLSNIFKYDGDLPNNLETGDTQTEWVVDEGTETEANVLESRKSIKDFPITVNLSSENLVFNKVEIPEEGSVVKEEDGKRVFFFGRVDPITEGGTAGLDNEIITDSWGGFIPTGGSTSVGNSGEESSVNLNEPIEVTYERFLRGE